MSEHEFSIPRKEWARYFSEVTDNYFDCACLLYTIRDGKRSDYPSGLFIGGGEAGYHASLDGITWHSVLSDQDLASMYWKSRDHKPKLALFKTRFDNHNNYHDMELMTIFTFELDEKDHIV